MWIWRISFLLGTIVASSQQNIKSSMQEGVVEGRRLLIFILSLNCADVKYHFMPDYDKPQVYLAATGEGAGEKIPSRTSLAVVPDHFFQNNRHVVWNSTWP